MDGVVDEKQEYGGEMMTDLKTQGGKTLVVGIAGPTCTGKSMVAGSIARKLGAQVISLESYYLDQSTVPMSERVKCNYDAPDSLDRDLILEQVKALASGQGVEMPVYDFAEHTRVPGRTKPVRSCPVLIVEGILALHWPELRSIFSKSFYFDAPSDTCLQRRRVRDIVERQRSHDFIVQQYQERVLPMAIRYVYPTKRYADVVVDATRSLDSVEAELMSHLSEKRAAAASARI